MESRTPINADLSPYDILGVKPGADLKEIRLKYLALVRAHHPDKNSEGAFSPDAFIAIQAAYETLTDPDKFLAYQRNKNNTASGSASSLMQIQSAKLDIEILAEKINALLGVAVTGQHLQESKAKVESRLKLSPGFSFRYEEQQNTLYLDHFIPGYKKMQSVGFHVDIPQSGPNADQLVIDQVPVNDDQGFCFIKAYFHALNAKISFMTTINEKNDQGQSKLYQSAFDNGIDINLFILIDAGAEMKGTVNKRKILMLYYSLATVSDLFDHFEAVGRVDEADGAYFEKCEGYKFAYSMAMPIAATYYYSCLYNKGYKTRNAEPVNKITADMIIQHFLATLTKPQIANLDFVIGAFRAHDDGYLDLQKFQDNLLEKIQSQPSLHALIVSRLRDNEDIALMHVLDKAHKEKLNKMLNYRPASGGFLGLFSGRSSQGEVLAITAPSNPRADSISDFLGKVLLNPLEAFSNIDPNNPAFNRQNSLSLKAAFTNREWNGISLSMTGVYLIDIAKLAVAYSHVKQLLAEQPGVEDIARIVNKGGRNPLSLARPKVIKLTFLLALPNEASVEKLQKIQENIESEIRNILGNHIIKNHPELASNENVCGFVDKLKAAQLEARVLLSPRQ